MMMMWPRRRSIIDLATARVTRKEASTLVRNMSSQSVSVMSMSGAYFRIPALLTRISTSGALLARSVDKARIVQIANDGFDGPPAALLRQRVELRLAAPRGDDSRTRLCERNSGCPADACARPRDEHCLTGQRHAHSASPLILWTATIHNATMAQNVEGRYAATRRCGPFTVRRGSTPPAPADRAFGQVPTSTALEGVCEMPIEGIRLLEVDEMSRNGGAIHLPS